jgi:hypothetical protein
VIIFNLYLCQLKIHSKMNLKGEQLYLKPNESKFLSVAVSALLDELGGASKNVLMNWNPETRKDIKDLLEAGNSLKVKLNKLGFDVSDLPPFVEGEEDNFLTKES